MPALPPSIDLTTAPDQGHAKSWMTGVRDFLSGLLGTTGNASDARAALGAAASGAATGSGLTISTGKLLGRTTAGIGALEEKSASEVLDMIGAAAHGDILFRGASGWGHLAAGAAGQFLKTGGAGANPAWGDQAAAVAFPAGTKMLFVQTSAPAGWTKDTTHNDKALRVVSGTVGSGGSVAFSTAFSRTATDGHTLSTTEMPSHAHGLERSGGLTPGGNLADQNSAFHSNVFFSTDYAGGGGSHTHPIDLRVQYVDVIIATKD